MSIYRVERKDDAVTVYRLESPDAVGNTAWTIVARLRADDKDETGRTVSSFSDEELIRAIAS